MLFRMAGLLLNLLYYSFAAIPSLYLDYLGLRTLTFLHEGYLWLLWWSHLMFLFLLFYVERSITSLYLLFLHAVDVSYLSSPARLKKIKFPGTALLTLDGRHCVFSEVINVYADSLAYLRRTLPSHTNSYYASFLIFLNKSRNKLGSFPPFGWPLRITMII